MGDQGLARVNNTYQVTKLVHLASIIYYTFDYSGKNQRFKPKYDAYTKTKTVKLQ